MTNCCVFGYCIVLLNTEVVRATTGPDAYNAMTKHLMWLYVSRTVLIKFDSFKHDLKLNVLRVSVTPHPCHTFNHNNCLITNV